ncbi:hypothetical protein EVAR_22918_1 [Eumeta japonica]|uniref:Uncharacterized protein n=1 Tax=Eumeta variegata TaxID=151549 RepID=A0A4C1UVH4_EUMVA|nr:hypothetical protein EVAR_22918_1 [Eumeta japonica]
MGNIKLRFRNPLTKLTQAKIMIETAQWPRPPAALDALAERQGHALLHQRRPAGEPARRDLLSTLTISLFTHAHTHTHTHTHTHYGTPSPIRRSTIRQLLQSVVFCEPLIRTL